MTAREAIVGRIRRSLGVAANDPRRNATVDGRLSRPPRGVIPARGQLSVEDRVALFITEALKVSATVARTADAADVPAAVADYLRAHNLPAIVRVGADPMFAAGAWSSSQIELKRGASDGSDAVGLSHAFAGVAETGTVVLLSGSDNPTTINFLPETHMVVVNAADIAGDYETAFDRIRARYGHASIPRTVNFVTGPSRSADIEQTLLLGAHGPRRLHIVVVG